MRYLVEMLGNGFMKVTDRQLQWSALFDQDGKWMHGAPIPADLVRRYINEWKAENPSKPYPIQ